MSKFAEQTRKSFEAAGLFEPKTRAVKLRYSLEDIDQAQSHGASLEQIMRTLEASGLVFPSLVAFKMALTRARKAGPMRSLADRLPNSAGQPSPEETSASLGTGKRVAGQNSSMWLDQEKTKVS